MARLFLSLVLALSCKSEGGSSSRSAAACIRYAVPPGWSKGPSKANIAVALFGPERLRLGGREARDTFHIRIHPAKGLTLDEHKGNLVSTWGSMQAKPGAPFAIVQSTGEVKEPVVTAQTIAGRPAYRIQSTTTIRVGSEALHMHNTILLIQFGEEIVQVVTGYPESRKAVTRPIAEAFLASISFGGC